MKHNFATAEIHKLTERVEGFLGRREGAYLYSLALVSAPKGPIVEIGSWKGKSTIWLAKASLALGGHPIYAIDPHFGGSKADFLRNIAEAGVGSKVIPIIEPSEKAALGWDKPISMLWIDGEHSYLQVRTDFACFGPHVQDDGIIAWHDTYKFDGVRSFVEDEILSQDWYKVLGQMDSILAVRKVATLSGVDRARRAAIVLLRDAFSYGRRHKNHWRALPRKLMRGLSHPRP